MKWIIVSCNYGRLGNRLHTHANILAWCIRHNYNLSNLSFRSYSNLFETKEHHSSDSYFQTKNILFYLMKFKFFRNFIERVILSKKWMRRLSFLLYHIEKDNFSLLEERELKLIKTNKIIIINAWDIRCQTSLKLVRENVREILRPASCYLNTAKNFVFNLKKHYDCLVGIHARRGDYRTYLNGKYYYSWKKYKNWILELKTILKDSGSRKIGFVLCSDEKPPKSILKAESIHYEGGQHFITDLHILTLCDYNIGPPSSFGTWVSWYGKVPRLVIEENTEITNINKLQVCDSC